MPNEFLKMITINSKKRRRNRNNNKMSSTCHKLFKDDHLYEKGLIDNPNFKLLSLRDFSAMDINKLAGSEEEQKCES